MLKKTVTIVNKLGLHARAASKLVDCATRFASETVIERDDKKVNAKSIMGVMMLGASRGTEIQLTVTGEDEANALATIEELINNRFGEAE